jgi:DNA (cytosine-5)-methyltransferase 1
MNELALFAGAGGGILGGQLLGWRTVCAVEIEPYAAGVLLQRQNDGILPPFPVWDDVCTFDGRPWQGIVDVISGGFPCQDISSAGKGDGITGERSGLWKEFARIIGEVQPRYVLVENSPMLTTRGLGTVLGDLAALGYDAEWGVLGAVDAGAPHKRDRIWIVAYSEGNGYREGRETGDFPETHGRQDGELPSIACGSSNKTNATDSRSDPMEKREIWQRLRAESFGDCQDVPDPQQTGLERLRPLAREPRHGGALADSPNEGNVRRIGSVGAIEVGDDRRGGQGNGCGEWWKTEPDVGRVVDWLATRVDRLKAIGNGQVPAVVALAWKTLTTSCPYDTITP